MKILAKALISSFLSTSVPRAINAQQQGIAAEKNTGKSNFFSGIAKYVASLFASFNTFKRFSPYPRRQRALDFERLKRIKNYYKLSLNYCNSNT